MRTGMFPRQNSRVYSQLTVSFPYSWTVSQAVLLSPVTRTVYRRLENKLLVSGGEIMYLSLRATA